jgi:hypothetical protein
MNKHIDENEEKKAKDEKYSKMLKNIKSVNVVGGLNFGKKKKKVCCCFEKNEGESEKTKDNSKKSCIIF